MGSSKTIVASFLALAGIWTAWLVIDYRASFSLHDVEDFQDASRMLLDRAERAVADYNITGATFGVLQDGLVQTRHVGYASPDKDAPITSATAFNWGSVSKPITGLGILRLAAEKDISLDDPVVDHLKQWVFEDSLHDVRSVTVRQLLQHTAGINLPGYSGYPSLSEPSQRPFRDMIRPPATLAEASSGLTPIRLLGEPGIKRRYSGGGYSLLQMMAEDVSGQPFPTLMRSNVTTPLHMNDSGFGRSAVKEVSDAFNHKGKAITDRQFLALAAAGFYASSDDMIKLLNVLIEQPDTFLPDDLWTSYLMPVDVNTSYAMSWTIEPAARGNLFSHGGNASTWHAKLAFAPEMKQGFFFVTNTTVGAQLEIDIGCAWRSYVRRRPAGEICQAEYRLTRNLTLAAWLAGVAAAFLIVRLWAAVFTDSYIISLMPRNRQGKLSAFKIALALLLIMLLVAVLIMTHSDLIYYREGVTFVDEIPLEEAGYLIFGIKGLLLAALLAMFCRRPAA